MIRIDSPAEIAHVLAPLQGSHMRTQREQVSLYGVACVFLMGSFMIARAVWHPGFIPRDWIDHGARLLPIGLVVPTPYLVAAGRVRYHITPEHIESCAPFGFFTWRRSTSHIIEIAYEYGNYNARYLTFLTHGGENALLSAFAVSKRP